MKKVIFVILLVFFTFTAKSQLTGLFDVGWDRGVAVVYFTLTNVSYYTMYNLTAEAVNYERDESKSWTIPLLRPGQKVRFGTKDNWFWLPGERLIVSDEQGNQRYWICPNY